MILRVILRDSLFDIRGVSFILVLALLFSVFCVVVKVFFRCVNESYYIVIMFVSQSCSLTTNLPRCGYKCVHNRTAYYYSMPIVAK